MAFDILDIADRLHLQLHRRAGAEYIFICPFCSSDTEYPKLYVNPTKGTFICHHCHKSGSVTDLWAALTGLTTKEAYKQMINGVNGDITYEPDVPEPINLDYEKIHLVYSDFLKMLELKPEHRQNLLARGLPQSHLYPFKSLPEVPQERWKICRILNKNYGLENIPGFINRISQKGDRYWDCRSGPGFLIPTRNEKNIITGLQIRTNQKPKYIWFSFSGQAKATAHIFPGNGDPWIIEGILKTYVLRYFMKIPCIGIPGTNAWGSIPMDILRGGRIIVAYDMEANLYTLEARDRLVDFLIDNGYEVVVASWPKTLGKGIDDACLSIYKKGRTPTPEMFLPGIAA